MGSLDAHLKQATVASAPVPEVHDTTPRITEEVRKDNLRRLSYPVFITEYPDGKRSFVHNPSVGRDVLISGGGTDRGTGTTESLAMLGDEGSVSVEGIGEPEISRERDEGGRFARPKAEEPAADESEGD